MRIKSTAVCVHRLLCGRTKPYIPKRGIWKSLTAFRLCVLLLYKNKRDIRMDISFVWCGKWDLNVQITFLFLLQILANNVDTSFNSNIQFSVCCTFMQPNVALMDKKWIRISCVNQIFTIKLLLQTVFIKQEIVQIYCSLSDINCDY